MTNRIRFCLIAVMIATLIAVFSCNTVPPVSIEDRIAQFMADLNKADRTNVYTHIHTSAASYGGVVPKAYWDGLLATTFIPYSLSGLSVAGSVATATVNTTHLTYGGATWTFTMKESEPKVWKILQITSSAGVNPVP
jgi:hypothetical protein